tara:strand:+ start:5004 stop:5477 length:474 start_codon:yes stop_codon:yes gene_type:complete
MKMYSSFFILLAVIYTTLFAFSQPNIIFKESLQNINQKINQQKDFIDQNIGQIDSDIILEYSLLISRLEKISRSMKVVNQANQLRHESVNNSPETVEWTRNSIFDNISIIKSEIQIVIKLIEELKKSQNLNDKILSDITKEMELVLLICNGLKISFK